MSSCSFPSNVQAGNNQISTHTAQRSYEISSENNDYDAQMSNKNRSVTNQRVPLPRKRKACFYLSYFTFLILYLAFVLLTAYTYPLKPVCGFQDSDLDDFHNVSLINSTEKVKDSFYLIYKFINRNPLISVSYDDFLNITIKYYSDSHEKLYITNTTAPGFHQHPLNDTEVTLHVPAPELSQMKNTSVAFIVVSLHTKGSFHCRAACKKKYYTISASYRITL
ncbi:hypothetical protein LXL04_035955 [Taraxacum kok-saghyz]